VRGFTLIELIIVLLIMSVAAGLAGIIVSRGSGELELRVLTKNIATTLRYARNHAISEKKVISFVVWSDKKTYGLYDNFGQNADNDDVSPVVSKTIPEQLAVVFDNREDFRRIDFTPRGFSTGGTIEVKNQKGTKYYIVVNRITGRTEVIKDDDL
jgi:prepilin-type N-terminal cleavage/methylation domain-containing protein